MTRPDHPGDGDGWVECAAGHRHWGRYGAAGLLAHRRSALGTREVLLQHRAEWSHFGGTWGLLGGARASHETAVQGALREAAEEGAVDPAEVRIDGRYDDDHIGWSYVTVLTTASDSLTARPSGGESIDVVWHDASLVDELPLHPGFAASWHVLRSALAPLTVVVDAANVMGSRPDGWWRDRARGGPPAHRRCGLGRPIRFLQRPAARRGPAGAAAALVAADRGCRRGCGSAGRC